MWHKTPKGSIIHIRELKNNSYVSPDDDFHFRIGSKEYFEILFDNNFFEELNKDNTKPKVKQKIRNELTRRGIKIVKRVINE